MRMRFAGSSFLFACFAAAFTLAGPLAVHAQPAIDGFLIAKSACAATPAIRKPDNPGDVHLDVGHAYPLFAQNKVPGTHYWIGVEGATPERRWVKVDCGTRVVAVGDVPVVAEPASPGDTPPAKTEPVTNGGGTAPSTSNLLAISWQPAFCEGHANKTECRNQTEDRFDATHFALHGLWPQPRGKEYCGVSAADKQTDKASNWSALPEPVISAATRTALDKVMPGAQSNLERHEWIRHGTCYGEADGYFATAARLVEAIGASPVNELFAGRIGQSVSLDEVRTAFDEAFGEGAGQRIRIACSKDGARRLIGEITIGLAGEITPTTDLGTLILAASPTDGGCTDGVVDKVGPQ